MPAWLLYIMYAAQLLPIVEEAVKWVESIAAGQPGAFKKDQVLAFVKVALQGTATFSKLDPATIDALLTLAGPMIDLAVMILNTTGVFKKTTKPA